MFDESDLVRLPIAEKRFAVDIFFRNEAPVAGIGRIIAVVAHHKVMMRINLLCRPSWQALVVLYVEIIFLKFDPVDIYAAIPDLDRFTGQPNDPFHVAFIRLSRKPEDNDVTALKMAPANALDVVVNELVDQQTLAIMQMRKHRFTLDHDRLNRKNTEQNKHDQDQKDIANQPHSFCPEKGPRLLAVMVYCNIKIIRRVERAKGNCAIFTAIEHVLSFDSQMRAKC